MNNNDLEKGIIKISDIEVTELDCIINEIADDVLGILSTRMGKYKGTIHYSVIEQIYKDLKPIFGRCKNGGNYDR